MTRRRFTERQTLECAINQGAVIPCYRCKVPFTSLTIRAAQREHVHEVGLDGPDTIENCAYSHDDCHKIETFGSGATTAGSSVGRIAKAKRIERTGKMEVDKLPPGRKRSRKPKFKRSWPAGRKMQSRGFQTRKR